MIFKIFMAALLFEVVSAPILCAVAVVVIAYKYQCKREHLKYVMKTTGEFLMHVGDSKKEGDKE